MDGVTFVNGRPVGPGELAVRADDRGFMLGDGLFETLRAYGGVPFRLDAHLARLESGAARVGIHLPPDLADQVDAALAAFREGVATGSPDGSPSHGRGEGGGRERPPDASVRITVSRGPAPPGLAPPARAAPTVVVAVRPYRDDPELYRRGVRAVVAAGRRNEFSAIAGVKQLGYLDAVVALAEARERGADDAIFLDTSGHLAEATTSNLFLVVGDEILTPPLSCGILSGVTRAAVIEIAAAAGRSLREEALLPEALGRASEAFLTASNREIVPLVEVDGRPIGDGAPGAVTMELRDRFRALVRTETGR